MTHVKMRSFIAPGDVLQIEAQARAGRRATRILLSAHAANGKTVATARLETDCGRIRMTPSGKRRVAITGIGLVTPVGNDVATTWQALLAGRSGGAPRSPCSTPAASRCTSPPR